MPSPVNKSMLSHVGPTTLNLEPNDHNTKEPRLFAGGTDIIYNGNKNIQSPLNTYLTLHTDNTGQVLDQNNLSKADKHTEFLGNRASSLTSSLGPVDTNSTSISNTSSLSEAAAITPGYLPLTLQMPYVNSPLRLPSLDVINLPEELDLSGNGISASECLAPPYSSLQLPNDNSDDSEN